MSAKRARHIAMKRLINRCGLIWGPSTETEAYRVADNIHTSAYLSGVRAGLEAAAEKAGETKHPPGTDFEEGYDCGRADAEAAIRALSAESIAKEAEK